jgi:hypothetical protein
VSTIPLAPPLLSLLASKNADIDRQRGLEWYPVGPENGNFCLRLLYSGDQHAVPNWYCILLQDMISVLLLQGKMFENFGFSELTF